mgnify:FL=1
MKEKRHFGTSKDGFEISEYILDNGLIEAHFLDYGCIIKNVFVAGKDGKRRDVVLGYDDLKSYEENDGYLGAFVGRVANRIKNAEFTLDGVKYRLFANDGKNCLHGGKKGFDKKFFETKIEDDSITFTTCSFDGEEGFPGGLSIEVKYTLRGSALDIEYKAVATADTPVSFTNHSYFNLSDEDTALNHLLSVNSDFITPVNDTLIPTGELLSVSDTPFDFRKPQKVGLYIDYPHKQLKIAGGYDHNFVLKNYGSYEKVATLYAEDTGICMDVFTDNFGMQVYSGNFLNGAVGKNGRIHGKRAAICLETQGFPNAVNQVTFPSIIVKAGKTYSKRTTYAFSVQ